VKTPVESGNVCLHSASRQYVGILKEIMKNLLQIILFSTALLFASTSSAENILVLNDVEIATNSLPERPFEMIIEGDYGIPESYSTTCSNMVPCSFNPFLEAIHHSFATHRPIRISPDHIWLVLAQGFAAHANSNSEELRDRFVSHKGRKRFFDC